MRQICPSNEARTCLVKVNVVIETDEGYPFPDSLVEVWYQTSQMGGWTLGSSRPADYEYDLWFFTYPWCGLTARVDVYVWGYGESKALVARRITTCDQCADIE